MSGQLFYNQRWISGGGQSFSSINPADECTVWSGNAATAEDVDHAVKSARRAFPAWAALTLEQREAHVLAFCEKLKAEESVMAELIARETGKPLWESSVEAKTMQAKVNTSIKANNERTGNRVTDMPAGGRTVLKHRPHGVLAIFGPYNFPGHLPNGHIIPALLAGNTVVFKPSDLTPAVGELMVKLWEKSGLPTGVINLVQGQIETGKVLAGHPGIDGLLFTGSSRTGHMLHDQFGGQPEKILALEMGGNNPLIIDDTVDVKAAVYGIIQSAFISSGQRCTCARRLFVPESEQGDSVISALKQAVEQIKVGAWNADDQPFMGPVVSVSAAESILKAQADLKALGGEILLPVQRLPQGGAWLTPGIIDVTAINNLPDDEYFGPLLQVIRYSDFSEAVALANDTRYGLSAGLFSADRGRFTYFEQHIRAGIVNWNRQTTGAAGTAPFGGVGASGNHRPSAWYAADYCAYPVASVQSDSLDVPSALAPGITL